VDTAIAVRTGWMALPGLPAAFIRGEQGINDDFVIGGDLSRAAVSL
jgi:hypothetical protein